MTIEIVKGDWRFTRGTGTFINVRLAAGSTQEVPYDMIEFPEWINVSKVDERAIEALAMLWLSDHYKDDDYSEPDFDPFWWVDRIRQS